MTRKILLAAALALAIAPAAFAADGWYPDNTSCTGAVDATPALLPGKVASWCPVSTTTQLVNVKGMVDCNWNADTSGTSVGTVTLTVKKCSGSTTASYDCKNTLTDSTGNTTITSGDATGSFTMASGVWLISTTGGSTAANGRLLCTGR